LELATPVTQMEEISLKEAADKAMAANAVLLFSHDHGVFPPLRSKPAISRWIGRDS
jgi:hypothetical protein